MRLAPVATPFLALALVAAAPSVLASRAELLLDPATGDVLHAEHANLRSYPASLTKMMTAYLLLEAVDAGRLSFDEQLPVSAHAASQEGTELGLAPGSSISVRDVLLALIVRSANDAAVVAAEAIAGSEPAFAVLMTAKAAALGMNDTRFRNASGLTDPEQMTTARDMAILAYALQRDFPKHYHFFGTRSFDFLGQHIDSHNRFVRTYPGSDGLKTGFTCWAGYNLVASGERDGRRLIGVVLGASTPGARDARMVELFDAGFSSALPPTTLKLSALRAAQQQGAGEPINSKFLGEGCVNPTREPDRGAHQVAGFSLEFAIEVEKEAALDSARAFIRAHRKTLKGGKPMLIPRFARSIIYRVGVTGLDQPAATTTCTEVRATDGHCLVLTPEAGEWQMSQALKLMEVARQAPPE